MKKLILLLIITIYSFASSYNQQMLNKMKMQDKNITSFSFAIMGDNRDGDNILQKIIQKINKDSSISFAINNGDLTPDGYKKEFDSYLKIIKKSNKPLISVIGNHEIPWYDGESNYENIFGKTNFTFKHGKSYFIVLDSSSKKISKKEFKWLKSKLKISQKYQHRFVITHVPLYDPREGQYKKGHSLKKLKQAKKLNDLLDKYRVDMIFCSHIHFYYRGVWQKTPFIITGGAGAPLKQFKNSGFYNFVKVSIDGKKVEYKVIKIKTKAPGFIKMMEQSVKDSLNL